MKKNRGDGGIKKLPRLKVKGLGWDASKGICDFDQAKYFPFSRDLVIVVEGEAIRSYEDLLELVSKNHYEDRKFLEVVFLSTIVGG